MHAVVGTTGLHRRRLRRARGARSPRATASIAPNFAIGAVLMMRFAELAAPYFETAEIIELHHDEQDRRAVGHGDDRRPSAWRRRRPTGRPTRPSRGGRGRPRRRGPGGIRVHSVRLRGMVAHQEVLLGTAGQTLTIRHDTYDRTSLHARRAAGGEAGRRPARAHRRPRRPARVVKPQLILPSASASERPATVMPSSASPAANNCRRRETGTHSTRSDSNASAGSPT